MNQALYAHMNNKRKMKKKKEHCAGSSKSSTYYPIYPEFPFTLSSSEE
jgi:hypothetical protein